MDARVQPAHDNLMKQQRWKSANLPQPAALPSQAVPASRQMLRAGRDDGRRGRDSRRREHPPPSPSGGPCKAKLSQHRDKCFEPVATMGVEVEIPVVEKALAGGEP